LLILVLLVAPAANAYCATLCLAVAVSSGCAHGLQPTDDLPVDKTEPAIAVVWTPVPHRRRSARSARRTDPRRRPRAHPAPHL